MNYTNIHLEHFVMDKEPLALQLWKCYRQTSHFLSKSAGSRWQDSL